MTVVGQTTTTVGEEKHYNPRLTKPLDEFIKIMENLNLPYPKMIGKLEVAKALFYSAVKGEIKLLEGGRFLKNVSNYPQDYFISRPRRPKFKLSQYCEDIRIWSLHFG